MQGVSRGEKEREGDIVRRGVDSLFHAGPSSLCFRRTVPRRSVPVFPKDSGKFLPEFGAICAGGFQIAQNSLRAQNSTKKRVEPARVSKFVGVMVAAFSSISAILTVTFQCSGNEGNAMALAEAC
eukprot:152560-Rhodomonas_salina.1